MVIERILEENKLPSGYRQLVDRRMLSDLGEMYANKYANLSEEYVYETPSLLGSPSQRFVTSIKNDPSLPKLARHTQTIVRYTLE